MAFKTVSEFDIIFISYDEDNCEENWVDLQNKVPWAKRVHGVDGSDAAHKAAANLSETECFISVDADNVVDESFFNLELDMDHPKLKNKAITWAARNHINGLEYGNGGLKLWPKQYVLDMKTHENSNSADARNQIEFCWGDNYVTMSNQYCVTYPNGSPRQAFRAGFREGVKMSLDQGNKILPEEFKSRIWSGNYKRLITWCSVGADVEHGLWAMYGTRLGCKMALLSDWDFVNVRDFKYINQMWSDSVAPIFANNNEKASKCYKSGYSWDNDMLLSHIVNIGNELRKGAGIEVAELDEHGSRFFKSAAEHSSRMNILFTENELNELRRINR